MFTSLRVKGVRALDDVSVDLGRLTVLVGPNGSGKTTLLQSLRLTSDLMHQARFDSIRRDLKSWTALFGDDYRSPLPNTIAFGSAFHSPTTDKVGRFNLGWAPASAVPIADLRVEVGAVGVVITDDGNGTWLAMQDDPAKRAEVALAQTHIAGVHASRVFHFYGPSISSPSALEKARDLESDGRGLPSVLAFCRLNQPDSFERIVDGLRTVVPTVTGIRFDRVEMPAVSAHQPPRLGDSLLFDLADGATGVPASAISEGTLITLALFTCVHAPELRRQPASHGFMPTDCRISTVLLDNVEGALHPAAQEKLIEQIRAFLDHDTSLQVVATTQSPYLVDTLDPSEVRVTALRNGKVVCARMNEAPGMDEWQKVMHTGEIWSVIGQDWVAQPEQPAKADGG